MTASHYELGADASLLDRTTLRIFRWWRGAGRDFLRAYFLTQLALAAVLVVPLTAVPNSSSWHLVGAVAALLAPVVAWMVHRRRYGWRPVVENRRARRWGIGLGVALFLVTGVLLAVMVSYIGIAIAMLSPQGPLVLVPAIATGFLGWYAAAYRKRQLDDPLYP
jgi:hypothetical protein